MKLLFALIVMVVIVAAIADKGHDSHDHGHDSHAPIHDSHGNGPAKHDSHGPPSHGSPQKNDHHDNGHHH